MFVNFGYCFLLLFKRSFCLWYHVTSRFYLSPMLKSENTCAVKQSKSGCRNSHNASQIFFPFWKIQQSCQCKWWFLYHVIAIWIIFCYLKPHVLFEVRFSDIMGKRGKEVDKCLNKCDIRYSILYLSKCFRFDTDCKDIVWMRYWTQFVTTYKDLDFSHRNTGHREVIVAR